jgi:glutathione peroxidase
MVAGWRFTLVAPWLLVDSLLSDRSTRYAIANEPDQSGSLKGHPFVSVRLPICSNPVIYEANSLVKIHVRAPLGLMTMLRKLILVVTMLSSSLASADESSKQTAHSFDFMSIEGQALPMESFSGNAVLLVNTASRCGFTRQYDDLQAVWERYRDRGLVVLGVPSNDFGNQEPGTETEIKQFCEVNFNVDFPMTSKVNVKGEDAHPFYRWASKELGSAAKPRWNFHKYLISPNGQLVDWFSTPTSPTSERVLRAIEAHLPEPTASAR